MSDERIILCGICGQQNRIRAKDGLERARCARCSEALHVAQKSKSYGLGWFVLFSVAASMVAYYLYIPQSTSSNKVINDRVPPVVMQRQAEATAAIPSCTPQSPPKTGVLKTHPGQRSIAPLEIVTSSEASFLIKLYNVMERREELLAYIRPGATLTTNVPLGTYELRYAAGTTWCGEGPKFGVETIYSKADTTFTFSQEGERVVGYTVELILQVGGNLETSRIDPSQF